jgi:hypothetical protein
MTTQAPLVPADCDLRDFAFMPVDVQMRAVVRGGEAMQTSRPVHGGA